MNCNKLSSFNCISFLLLLFCFVDEAFSRKCYYCSSALDKECEWNAKQEKNIMDCGTLGLGPDHKRIKGNSSTDDEEDMIACFTLNLLLDGYPIVERMCLRKEVPCGTMEKTLSGATRMTGCSACTTDLCNGEPINPITMK